MKKNLSYLLVAALSMSALTLVSCDPETEVAKEYTIAVSASAGGTASAGVAKAVEGTPITVSAIANDGFRFEGWTVEAGDITLSGNPANFTMPAANVSIKADFVDATVPVTKENLSGSITGTKTLSADITYTITGPVIVEDGGTLTIPAGTLIEAEKGFNSYILVLQGGKINVDGTAADPVVMTSNAANPAAGDWGGLVINGLAPLSGGSTGETEISKQFLYGGNAEGDDSGRISYLILAYTGARSSANVEHNGLTLNGVGNGTEINNVFIYEGSDDGIEFFGGSVDVTGLLVVNSDDDMFDFTQGYNGTLKNAYGIWEPGFSSSEADPRGIEADGNLDNDYPEHDDQSDFTVENITFDLRLDYFDGTPAYTGDAKTMQDLMKIRRGAVVDITNALVKGTGRVEDLIDLSDDGVANLAPSTISLTNSLATSPAAANLIKRSANYPAAPEVVIEAGNAGCDASLFDWVADAGYDVF